MRNSRTVWYVGGGLLFAAFALMSLLYSYRQREGVVCSGMQVRILDSGQYRFVTPSRVESYLRMQVGDFRGRALCEVNTHELEEVLYRIPSIRSAQAYVCGNGEVHLRLRQRVPMFRVMAQDGRSCYVDREGKSFSLDANYVAHVLVVSGNVSYPPDVIPHSGDSLRSEGEQFWHDLFNFASYVYRDKVWRALFAQVYVLSTERIELIPRVGGQVIVLGSLQDYEYKLNKLWSLYQAVLPGDGLNAYSEINLMYGNQAVCVRR